MRNIDSISCLYYWNNRTTDSFVCMDMWFDGNRAPVSTTETQDARNVRTGPVNVRNGLFTVSFQRPFRTADPATLDFPLTLGENDFIWSFGNIVGGTPQQHSVSGTIRFNVQTGQIIGEESFAKYLQSVVALSTLLLAYALF